MLRVFARGGASAECDDAAALWYDLESPTAEEEADVEQALGVDVPTPDERAAFEDSARFYEERESLHLTATLLGRRDEGALVSGPVTFILVKGKLVTVRQVRPRAFDIGQGRASARVGSAQNGGDIMLALLEGAAERLADVLADATRDANTLSQKVFADEDLDLRTALRELGRIGALSALAHDSLSSLQRLVVYARASNAKQKYGIDNTRLSALARDVGELERIAETMQPRLSYLQDAMLGLINAAQTNVLKALSLATIAFVPATLIASIFGMNFHFTWFERSWGPAVTFALMILAPAALFAIAKWRRWF